MNPMKVHLLSPDSDINLDDELPPLATTVIDDLGIEPLCQAMAGGDELILAVTRHLLMTPLMDPERISYRQDVFADCVQHPEVIREMYDVALETQARQKKIYWGVFSNYPAAVLRGAHQSMTMLVQMLIRLRDLAHQHEAEFTSRGFRTLFAMLQAELDDDYLSVVKDNLNGLQFRHGELLSAGLGPRFEGDQHVLRKPTTVPHPFIDKLRGTALPSHSFRLADRDDAGAQILGELRARGVNQVANALAQSTENILGFFDALRTELAFLVGCLELHTQLTQAGAPVCRPEAIQADSDDLGGRGLYDPNLVLGHAAQVVINDLDADGADLIVITGANQGGKSTFLRAIGLAQAMTQAGMFVAASSYCASVSTMVMTHFKREEDSTMTSGKLDEELHRMSQIADHVRPGGLVLFNESFSSTNEREGSQIGREVIRALREADIRVVFVTHQFDLANGLFKTDDPRAVFLRAQRGSEQGDRNFQIAPGEPLSTSYGEDLYQQIFG